MGSARRFDRDGNGTADGGFFLCPNLPSFTMTRSSFKCH